MTQQESLTLIAEMLNNTKRRYNLEDGNNLLIWGYVSVITALVVWATLFLTFSPWSNCLWFAIPIVGWGLQVLTRKEHPQQAYVKTYTDRIISGVWTFIGWLPFALSVICLVFQRFGYPQAWGMMMVYGLTFVGLGILFTGIILEEISMKIGGCTSVVIGSIITCAILSDVFLPAVWFFPAYCLAFTLMLIVPGHIIRAKALRSPNDTTIAPAHPSDTESHAY